MPSTASVIPHGICLHHSKLEMISLIWNGTGGLRGKIMYNWVVKLVMSLRWSDYDVSSRRLVQTKGSPIWMLRSEHIPTLNRLFLFHLNNLLEFFLFKFLGGHIHVRNVVWTEWHELDPLDGSDKNWESMAQFLIGHRAVKNNLYFLMAEWSRWKDYNVGLNVEIFNVFCSRKTIDTMWGHQQNNFWEFLKLQIIFVEALTFLCATSYVYV